MKLKEIANQIFKEKRNTSKIVYEHLLQLNCFSETIDEDSSIEKRKEVLSAISKGKWEKPQNPQSFLDSLMKSKHLAMLTPYSISELSSMKLFKLDGYNIGYALKKKDGKYSEIVAVHNNEPDVKQIGKELVLSAVKNGGCYLDHFDGMLSNLYSSIGFEEYSRDEFDPQYDTGGEFEKKYGKQDIIYRVHRSCK
jgi:hypothetical protein